MRAKQVETVSRAPLRTPTLEVSTPTLGATAVCSGVALQPGALGLLVVAQPGAVWQVTPQCATHLDLGAYAGLATFAAAAGGDWQVSVPLPNAPYLQGLQVGLQAVFAPTLGPRGYELSESATATLQ